MSEPQNPYKLPNVNLAENISSYQLAEIKQQAWELGADAMKAYYEAEIKRLNLANELLAKTLKENLETYQIEKPALGEEQVRETIASAEHEQWIRWAKSITIELKILTANHPKDCVCKTCLRIPRWEKLFIPYAELTEESKDQDRKEADIVLSLVGSRQEGRQEVIDWVNNHRGLWNQWTLWVAQLKEWGIKEGK